MSSTFASTNIVQHAPNVRPCARTDGRWTCLAEMVCELLCADPSGNSAPARSLEHSDYCARFVGPCADMDGTIPPIKVEPVEGQSRRNPGAERTGAKSGDPEIHG